MTLSRLLLLATLCLGTTLTHGAGFAFIDVPADKDGPALHGGVWTPCEKPAKTIDLGGIVVSGVTDCPIASTGLPLVVISHGSGGSFLGHHDTAEALADSGFVAAAISHPGDSFEDLSRQAHLSAFSTRPVDLRRLVDYMMSTWAGHAVLAPGRVGVFGFSRGGYTGLVAAGAVPDFSLWQYQCPSGSAFPMCVELHDGELPLAARSDLRVKALVIVDPLSAFDAQGLEKVNVPVQLWSSEFGGDGVKPESVAAVRDGLPIAPEWHVAIGAGHFAFLAPCAAVLTKEMPEICSDKPGFDRTAFHSRFNLKVISFFKAHLRVTSKERIPAARNGQ